MSFNEFIECKPQRLLKTIKIWKSSSAWRETYKNFLIFEIWNDVCVFWFFHNLTKYWNISFHGGDFPFFLFFYNLSVWTFEYDFPIWYQKTNFFLFTLSLKKPILSGKETRNNFVLVKKKLKSVSIFFALF